MGGRRQLTVLAAVGVLALSVLTACGSDAPEAAPSASATPTAATTTVTPSGPVAYAGRGPRPPERGAWFGAFLQTPDPSAAGRTAALAALEQQVGRPLTIAHSFHPWEDSFPTATDEAYLDDGKLLLLSWAGTDTRSITLGRYDDVIRQRAQAVKGMGVPILLRFRWEMDRPNLQASVHSPADYIAAWKRVRGIFTEVGATNAAWVWCPLATGFPDGRAQQFYPGDDQVDWICADAYAGREVLSFQQLMTPVLEWAKDHPRPILVGEFGVSSVRGGDQAKWLADARTFAAAHPQIKGYVYFGAKREVKPVYDSTLSSPESIAAFTAFVGDPQLRAEPPPGLR